MFVFYIGPSKWLQNMAYEKEDTVLAAYQVCVCSPQWNGLCNLFTLYFGFCNSGTLIIGKILGHFHLLASGEWMPLWVQQHAYYWRLLHISLPSMICMWCCCSLLSSPTLSKLLIWKDVIFCAFCIQKYHPTRVVTLTYQPFVLATTAIFTYHEAKVNTRLHNLAGYTLFFLSSFAVIIVSMTNCIGTFLFE